MYVLCNRVYEFESMSMGVCKYEYEYEYEYEYDRGESSLSPIGFQLCSSPRATCSPLCALQDIPLLLPLLRSEVPLYKLCPMLFPKIFPKILPFLVHRSCFDVCGGLERRVAGIFFNRKVLVLSDWLGPV